MFRNIPLSTGGIFQEPLRTLSSYNLSGREDRGYYGELNPGFHDPDSSISTSSVSGSFPSHQFGSPIIKIEEPNYESSQSSIDHERFQPGRATGTSENALLKSLESFKVLTECPLIIMLLFQIYPKFISRNIPQFLPLMMAVLGITLPPNAAQLHKIRFREFLASQVQTSTHSFFLICLKSVGENIVPNYLLSS